MNTAGRVRAQLGGIDQRGQPPPPRIRTDCRQRNIWIGDAQQIVEEQQVLGLGAGSLGSYLGAGRRVVQIPHAGGRPQQMRYRVKGDVAGMRFAIRREYVDAPGGGHRGDHAHQTALADARCARHADHRAVAVDRAFQHALDGGRFPAPTDQIRLGTPRAGAAPSDTLNNRLARTG